MNKSPLEIKTYEFAKEVIFFYQKCAKEKKDLTLANQLLRSGTSVGANYCEAQFGSSKADFTAKIRISRREISESIYWMKLFTDTNTYDYDFTKMLSLADEILRMLTSSIKKSTGK